MKTITVESKAKPDVPGYPDRIAVANARLLYHGDCGACPNPRQPWVKGGKRWDKAYGWLQCGKYQWECINHYRRGLVLVVNYGLAVPSRNANPNHEGRHILTQILIHKGWTARWRGSAGCITIPPRDWKAFIGCFKAMETGVLRVVDWGQVASAKRAGWSPSPELGLAGA